MSGALELQGIKTRTTFYNNALIKENICTGSSVGVIARSQLNMIDFILISVDA